MTVMRASIYAVQKTSNWLPDSGAWCPPASLSPSRTAWWDWFTRVPVWLRALGFRS
jgi:hypothetical protein